MKRIFIFEPAMCCSTGLCGPGVDPELLRIATVINHLVAQGISVKRYNLNHNPEAFIQNAVINEFINQHGVEGLPVTIVDEKIIKTGAYLTNEEFCEILGISRLDLQVGAAKKCHCKGKC